MKRLLRSTAILVVGVLVGLTVGAAVGAGPIEPAATPPVGAIQDRPTTSTSTTTTTSPVSVATTALEPAEAAPVYLVWATGGLDADLVDGLEANFADVSVVFGDVADLGIGGDAVIPLDAVAVDPGAHAFFDGGATGALGPGTVLLSESSAELRAGGIGDILTINQGDYEVVGIVPDALVGAAEVVFASRDSTRPVSTARFAIVGSDLARTEFEQAVRALYDGPAPLRIRAEGETPILRHGDAVLPQVALKLLLGEFAFVRADAESFTLEDEWQRANLVSAEVPLIGRVTCHRLVVDALRGAMTELADAGLGHLVDPSGYRGCFEPRFIRAKAGAGSSVSRHSWGAAVDMNATTNQVGSIGDMDPRLVEVMKAWGFVWGGDWLVPDPMHFEYYGGGAG